MKNYAQNRGSLTCLDYDLQFHMGNYKLTLKCRAKIKE